jgi:hypothetical protein
VYGITFEHIPLSFDPTVVRPQVEIPPHYPGHPGTEEDSLGSFLYLTTKVPKKNFTRMMDYDQKVFRFMARIDSGRVDDQDRVFVVKYFMADDSIGVFEPPARNSGIIGGKFLERAKLKKPNGEWYLQSDFHVGAKVCAQGHVHVCVCACMRARVREKERENERDARRQRPATEPDRKLEPASGREMTTAEACALRRWRQA